MAQFFKKTIKNLLKKYKIYPSKRFGQNFLVDERVLRKIMAAADLKSGDTILEIGPGTGILTQELAKRAKKVIVIEKDQKMVEILMEKTKNLKNVKIIQGDILKYEVGSTKKRRNETTLKTSGFRLQTSYKVVANLPYYIVSPVLRKFLENKNPPKEMVLMVQKEVAQRITAQPPDMNLLAVSVQFYSKPKIISFVSKKSFWPQPKVESAILKISNIRLAADPRRRSAFNQRFFTIVKNGFSQPRKQIINNLSKGLKVDREKIKNWLLKNEVQPQQRAETLSIKQWIRLANTFPFFSFKVK